LSAAVIADVRNAVTEENLDSFFTSAMGRSWPPDPSFWVMANLLDLWTRWKPWGAVIFNQKSTSEFRSQGTKGLIKV
jgi:hypothetical protein